MTNPRIPALDPGRFTAEQDELVGGWSDLNFSRVLINHPEIYRVFVPYIAQTIGGSQLPPRDREVLVVRTLALSDEVYEQHHHLQIAHKAGLSEAEIAAVKTGDGSLSAWDRALVRAADELVRDQRLSDASWAALAERYSPVEMMDVVFLVGCYTTMAMATNSFGIELEGEGTDERLKALRQYT